MTDRAHVNFRSRARDALARAKGHLASDAPDRARYAALDLRLALEAVAYETAQSYADELPESAYETWQPPALVDALLEVNPHADRSVTLRIREEGAGDGAPWLDLGEDRRTPVKLLTKFYHSLGSLLHVPTLAQMRQGKNYDEQKAAKRCNDVAEELELVLASPVFAVNLRNLVNFECTRCKKPVVRTVPSGVDNVIAKCRHCGASYDVKDGETMAKTRGEKVPCLKCKHEQFLLEDELRPGVAWQCPKCGAQLSLRLTLMLDEVQ